MGLSLLSLKLHMTNGKTVPPLFSTGGAQLGRKGFPQRRAMLKIPAEHCTYISNLLNFDLDCRSPFDVPNQITAV